MIFVVSDFVRDFLASSANHFNKQYVSLLNKLFIVEKEKLSDNFGKIILLIIKLSISLPHKKLSHACHFTVKTQFWHEIIATSNVQPHKS